MRACDTLTNSAFVVVGCSLVLYIRFNDSCHQAQLFFFALPVVARRQLRAVAAASHWRRVDTVDCML